MEETILELDAQVEFLINKNIQYREEIERLRELLDKSNSENYSPQSDSSVLSDKLEPLLKSAENMLERIKAATTITAKEG